MPGFRIWPHGEYDVFFYLPLITSAWFVLIAPVACVSLPILLPGQAHIRTARCERESQDRAVLTVKFKRLRHSAWRVDERIFTDYQAHSHTSSRGGKISDLGAVASSTVEACRDSHRDP